MAGTQGHSIFFVCSQSQSKSLKYLWAFRAEQLLPSRYSGTLDSSCLTSRSQSCSISQSNLGSLETMSSQIWQGSSALTPKGTSSEMNSYRHTPRDHRSVEQLQPLPESASGDMQWGVPMMVQVLEVGLVFMFLQEPMSTSLRQPSGPSITFCGLRSLQMVSIEWMYSRMSRIEAVQKRMAVGLGDSDPMCRAVSRSSPFMYYSRKYMLFSSLYDRMYSRMNGKFTTSRILFSCYRCFSSRCSSICTLEIVFSAQYYSPLVTRYTFPNCPAPSFLRKSSWFSSTLLKALRLRRRASEKVRCARWVRTALWEAFSQESRMHIRSSSKVTLATDPVLLITTVNSQQDSAFSILIESSPWKMPRKSYFKELRVHSPSSTKNRFSLHLSPALQITSPASALTTVRQSIMRSRVTSLSLLKICDFDKKAFIFVLKIIIWRSCPSSLAMLSLPSERSDTRPSATTLICLTWLSESRAFSPKESPSLSLPHSFPLSRARTLPLVMMQKLAACSPSLQMRVPSSQVTWMSRCAIFSFSSGFTESNIFTLPTIYLYSLYCAQFISSIPLRKLRRSIPNSLQSDRARQEALRGALQSSANYPSPSPLPISFFSTPSTRIWTFPSQIRKKKDAPSCCFIISVPADTEQLKKDSLSRFARGWPSLKKLLKMKCLLRQASINQICAEESAISFLEKDQYCTSNSGSALSSMFLRQGRSPSLSVCNELRTLLELRLGCISYQFQQSCDHLILLMKPLVLARVVSPEQSQPNCAELLQKLSSAVSLITSGNHYLRHQFVAEHQARPHISLYINHVLIAKCSLQMAEYYFDQIVSRLRLVLSRLKKNPLALFYVTMEPLYLAVQRDAACQEQCNCYLKKVQYQTCNCPRKPETAAVRTRPLCRLVDHFEVDEKKRVKAQRSQEAFSTDKKLKRIYGRSKQLEEQKKIKDLVGIYVGKFNFSQPVEAKTKQKLRTQTPAVQVKLLFKNKIAKAFRQNSINQQFSQNKCEQAKLKPTVRTNAISLDVFKLIPGKEKQNSQQQVIKQNSSYLPVNKKQEKTEKNDLGNSQLHDFKTAQSKKIIKRKTTVKKERISFKDQKQKLKPNEQALDSSFLLRNKSTKAATCKMQAIVQQKRTTTKLKTKMLTYTHQRVLKQKPTSSLLPRFSVASQTQLIIDLCFTSRGTIKLKGKISECFSTPVYINYSNAIVQTQLHFLHLQSAIENQARYIYFNQLPIIPQPLIVQNQEKKPFNTIQNPIIQQQIEEQSKECKQSMPSKKQSDTKKQQSVLYKYQRTKNNKGTVTELRSQDQKQKSFKKLQMEKTKIIQFNPAIIDLKIKYQRVQEQQTIELQQKVTKLQRQQAKQQKHTSQQKNQLNLLQLQLQEYQKYQQQFEEQQAFKNEISPIIKQAQHNNFVKQQDFAALQLNFNKDLNEQPNEQTTKKQVIAQPVISQGKYCDRGATAPYPEINTESLLQSLAYIKNSYKLNEAPIEEQYQDFNENIQLQANSEQIIELDQQQVNKLESENAQSFLDQLKQKNSLDQAMLLSENHLISDKDLIRIDQKQLNRQQLLSQRSQKNPFLNQIGLITNGQLQSEGKQFQQKQEYKQNRHEVQKILKDQQLQQRKQSNSKYKVIDEQYKHNKEEKKFLIENAIATFSTKPRNQIEFEYQNKQQKLNLSKQCVQNKQKIKQNTSPLNQVLSLEANEVVQVNQNQQIKQNKQEKEEKEELERAVFVDVVEVAQQKEKKDNGQYSLFDKEYKSFQNEQILSRIQPLFQPSHINKQPLQLLIKEQDNQVECQKINQQNHFILSVNDNGNNLMNIINLENQIIKGNTPKKEKCMIKQEQQQKLDQSKIQEIQREQRIYNGIAEPNLDQLTPNQIVKLNDVFNQQLTEQKQYEQYEKQIQKQQCTNRFKQKALASEQQKQKFTLPQVVEQFENLQLKQDSIQSDEAANKQNILRLNSKRDDFIQLAGQKECVEKCVRQNQVEVNIQLKSQAEQQYLCQSEKQAEHLNNKGKNAFKKQLSLKQISKPAPRLKQKRSIQEKSGGALKPQPCNSFDNLSNTLQAVQDRVLKPSNAQQDIRIKVSIQSKQKLATKDQTPNVMRGGSGFILESDKPPVLEFSPLKFVSQSMGQHRLRRPTNDHQTNKLEIAEAERGQFSFQESAGQNAGYQFARVRQKILKLPKNCDAGLQIQFVPLSSRFTQPFKSSWEAFYRQKMSRLNFSLASAIQVSLHLNQSYLTRLFQNYSRLGQSSTMGIYYSDLGEWKLAFVEADNPFEGLYEVAKLLSTEQQTLEYYIRMLLNSPAKLVGLQNLQKVRRLLKRDRVYMQQIIVVGRSKVFSVVDLQQLQAEVLVKLRGEDRLQFYMRWQSFKQEFEDLILLQVSLDHFHRSCSFRGKSSDSKSVFLIQLKIEQDGFGIVSLNAETMSRGKLSALLYQEVERNKFVNCGKAKGHGRLHFVNFFKRGHFLLFLEGTEEGAGYCAAFSLQSKFAIRQGKWLIPGHKGFQDYMILFLPMEEKKGTASRLRVQRNKEGSSWSFESGVQRSEAKTQKSVVVQSSSSIVSSSSKIKVKRVRHQ